MYVRVCEGGGAYLGCSQSLHDANEREKVGVFLSAKQVCHEDVAMQQPGSLQRVPSRDHSQSHSLSKIQVPARRQTIMNTCVYVI